MADETKVQGPGIEQGGPEAPLAPDAEKVPEQLETENLTSPAADGQPEQAAPAEESKGEPEKPDGKIIDITGKMAQGHDTPDKADKASEPPVPDKDTRPDGEKPRRGRPPKEKTGPGDKSPKPKGRTAKDKSAPAKGKAQRDKMSRGKKGKTAPEQSSDKGGSGPAVPPVAEQPAEPTPPPRPVEEQKIVYLKLSDLHPFHTFREHPFKVVDDSPRMQELVSSIKAQGVFTPATVRPEKDGNGYEIIAGHCRMRGSELAGLEELPCIVRDMDDHEAVQEMKNSNKQRGDPLPSELARLLDLEVEDIKHQGGRLKGVAEGDIGKRSVEIVGEEHGMNYKKVMRYIRLNSLVPELLDMADAKRIGFMPAVELSYIKPKNQRFIAVSIEGEQSSPSVAQAKRMRELDKDGKLTPDIIDGILSEEKKEVDRVIITTDELNKYFGKEFTPRQMKDQIIALLDDWKEKQPPELAKPDKTADKEH